MQKFNLERKNEEKQTQDISKDKKNDDFNFL